MDKISWHTVDDYIAQFPASTQQLLQELRVWIREAAPEAEECISYNMPAYMWNGPLVYFAGYKNHIGFYPTGSGMAAFAERFSAYKTSKGAVQFPLNQPLPKVLIQEITQYRLEQNKLKEKRPRT
jgi:uncharacterized protein YdhG (YjbR/CyaY superfamily)